MSNQQERAASALRKIAPMNGEELETDMRDMLSDMLHLCDQMGYDFNDNLRIAHDNYTAEVLDDRGSEDWRKKVHALAEDEYGSNDLMIDLLEESEIERVEHGAWVSARVFVPLEDDE